LAKFINKKADEDGASSDGRVIYFSKTPPENADASYAAQGNPAQIKGTEFDKLTKNEDEPIFDTSKKKDRIVTINNIMEQEKKELNNIQALIRKQSQSLERAKKLFKEKQGLLQTELNKSSNKFSNDKFSIMGQLSSKMAHDIRNPLNVIKVQVDLLKLRYSKQEDTIMLDSLGRMERAVGGITSQLNDVLNFLKESPMHYESNSLLKMLDESILYVQKPDNIRIEFPTNDVVVLCDDSKMQRVFANIIQNSIQVLDKGGAISISHTEQEDHTLIAIKDTGPGIQDELLPKIFEPLFTTKSDGTGLGLPICKKIVEDHGGSISVRNNPTTFTIKIPKTQPV
jgi:signal transduction histidine kinase